MKLRLLLLALLSTASLLAQNPVKWSFSTKDNGNCQIDLIFTATIDDGWYTYSQFLESDEGPVATSFTYAEGPHYKLVGKAVEGGEKIKVFDKVFGMNLTKFKHKAIFTQRVEVKDPSKPIEGYLEFMVCNDESCLPPTTVDYKFAVSCTSAPADAKPGEKPADGKTGEVAPPSPADTGSTAVAAGPTTATPDDPNFKGFFDAKRAAINSAKFVNDCGIAESEDSSLLWVFIGGFLGGLLALLTPCVFPMIPMTVSFFVKRSKDRATGLRNALWYGSSIVVIYAGIGILLTSLFGPTILNELSTNMWFNIAFFVIFIVFALSFFGLFEITLPSSWVNKSDQMADKGGMLGIFFMAATLALVSFSCTGPIVGTLLVETAKTNAGEALFGFIPVRPTVGMFGFGLALALPFALFAMFPGWLNSLPKSGGWMDNVKITLGFVEVALALKFLSTADMVSHWGFLKFELFLGLWLIIGLLLSAYQLGLFNWKGAKGRPGFTRLTVGLASVAFSIYLGYGLLNYQSLSLLSGLAPPVHYNFFRPMDCPHGLDCYHDFDEGLAEAKRQNKPLFVDFTGYGCVNCRKMEENVWHRPGIIEHLRNNYVVVSLYVDDKERLFPDNKFSYLLDPNTGEKLRTVGDKWSAFQVNNFGVSAQPYYVLMHNDGTTLLNQPTDYQKGHEPDVYKAFLDCGYNAFLSLKDKPQQQPLLGIGTE
ncbi:MAG: thioredoxin family protein [Saprospiraceae bacterium]|nr:thioredoxin family protein [Saprospiraceae bacterium]